MVLTEVQRLKLCLGLRQRPGHGLALRERLALCGLCHLGLAQGLALLGAVEARLGVVLVLLGLSHDALIAGRLEGGLRLYEMPRPLIVEGAGREGAGGEGGQV